MGKKKILLVDDDVDFVEATKVILETKYEVVTANGSDEGWQRLKEVIPDLIILDVMMEGKGAGFIFSRKMRKIPQYSRIPILMLTGMREQTGFYFVGGDPRHDKFLPVEEFVEKPIDPQNLLERIDKVLNPPRKENSSIGEERY